MDNLLQYSHPLHSHHCILLTAFSLCFPPLLILTYGIAFYVLYLECPLKDEIPLSMSNVHWKIVQDGSIHEALSSLTRKSSSLVMDQHYRLNKLTCSLSATIDIFRSLMTTYNCMDPSTSATGNDERLSIVKILRQVSRLQKQRINSWRRRIIISRWTKIHSTKHSTLRFPTELLLASQYDGRFEPKSFELLFGAPS